MKVHVTSCCSKAHQGLQQGLQYERIFTAPHTQKMTVFAFYYSTECLPSRQIANRRDKFIKSDSQCNNLLTFVTM